MEFKIRVRADGVLYEMVPPPRHLANAIVSRVKIMADLDIAERRLPQDGRIELNVGGNPVDLRVSVLPNPVWRSRRNAGAGPNRRAVRLEQDRHGSDDTFAFPGK